MAKEIISTIAGALFHGADYFVYPGHYQQKFRGVVETPASFDLPYEEVFLRTSDNVKLHAYLLLQQKNTSDTHPAKTAPVQRSEGVSSESALKPTVTTPTSTVLMLHGNGDNIGCWLPHARQFYRRMGCNVFMLEYRGYGRSEGRPSESGLQIDAQTALDYITSHPLLRSTRTILYGQSLGGAVAIDLASRFPNSIHAIILENTPLSLASLVPHRLGSALGASLGGALGALGAAVAVPLGWAIVPCVGRDMWESVVKLERIVGKERRCGLREASEGVTNEKGHRGVRKNRLDVERRLSVLGLHRGSRTEQKMGRRWSRGWKKENRASVSGNGDEEFLLVDVSTGEVVNRDDTGFDGLDVTFSPTEDSKPDLCASRFPPQEVDKVIDVTPLLVDAFPYRDQESPFKADLSNVDVEPQSDSDRLQSYTNSNALASNPTRTHDDKHAIAILMLSGLRDTIVPPSHMRTLWEIVKPDVEAESPTLPGFDYGSWEDESAMRPSKSSTRSPGYGFGTASSRGTMSTSRSYVGRQEAGTEVFTPPELSYSDNALNHKRNSQTNDFLGVERSTWRRWSCCFSGNSLSHTSTSLSTSPSPSPSFVEPPPSSKFTFDNDMSSSKTSLAQHLELGASDATLKTRSSVLAHGLGFGFGFGPESSEGSESAESSRGHERQNLGYEWRKCHFVEFERGGHNDTSIQPGYWCVIANFISNL